MKGIRSYPLGVMVLRSIVLPASLIAWATVIVLALTQDRDQSRTAPYDLFANVILTGQQ